MQNIISDLLLLIHYLRKLIWR